MTDGRARVLYLPNENEFEGGLSQRGPRRALGGMLDAELVKDVRIVSLLHRVRKGDGPAERARLLEIIQEFQPTIVLFSKPGDTGVTSRDLDAWRRAADFRLILSEMDPYHWWFKPHQRETRIVARYADVAFVPGSASFVRLLRRDGARDVRWIQQGYDPGWWGRSPIVADTVVADVVLTGSRIRSRYAPFRGLPGAPDRVRAVAALASEFGDAFHVYGAGWDVPGAKGLVPYESLESALRTAWVSANWDHFPYEPDYYSNRLPISLAIGTVHFTTRHPGFDRQFGELPFLRFVDHPAELVPAINDYLRMAPPETRLEHARQGRVFADAHLRQDEQITRMLNAAGAGIDLTVARTVFREGSRMLTEE